MGDEVKPGAAIAKQPDAASSSGVTAVPAGAEGLDQADAATGAAALSSEGLAAGAEPVAMPAAVADMPAATQITPETPQALTGPEVSGPEVMEPAAPAAIPAAAGDRIASRRADTPRGETLAAALSAASPPGATASVAPIAPRPRRGGFIAPLVGGALAAVLGYGLAHYDVLQLRQGLEPNQLEARFADLESKLAAAEAAAAQGQEAISRADAAMAKAEANAEAAGNSGADSAQLAELQAQLAGLAKEVAQRPTATGEGGASAAALAALQAQVEQLRDAQQGADPAAVRAMVAQELQAKVDATLAEAETQAQGLRDGAAADVARSALREAIASGRPFAAELSAANISDLPAALTARAELGLPALSDLAARFPDLARLALDAAIRADAGEGLGDKAWSLMRLGLGARSLTPREGTDADAVLSRAEAAVQAGNLTTALQELQGLPAAAKTVMAEWISEAQARIDAEAALAALSQ